jgi:conjugative relaxase-like TrwC/TraI family protein
MVATLQRLSSAAGASSYYSAAGEYYAEGGVAPSSWEGKGAEALGLSGEVNPDTFEKLLNGQLPDGTILGTVRGGELEHAPGWDVTFSAPKSVSVMALVAGDERLIEAQDKAVSATIAFAEKYVAMTRIRDGEAVNEVNTENLLVATFRHETSRADDPLIHTHSIILNAVQDADGKWRSMESRELYKLQMTLGEVYRQNLAHNVVALGYQIEKGKDSMFEIVGVPHKVLETFSTRSAQIEEHLAKNGKDRSTASVEEKQMATLISRDAKSSSDRGALVTKWRAQADDLGFSQRARTGLVQTAKDIAAQPRHDISLEGRAQIHAGQAVAFAASKLSEREAVVAASDLVKEAGRFVLGRASPLHIDQAVQKAVAERDLVERAFVNRRGLETAGFTTPANIEAEKQILFIERAGRGSTVPILTGAQAAILIGKASLKAQDQGHAWNVGQKRATLALLTTANRVSAVQGFAGTAKTTTVMKTLAYAAKAQGLEVRAFAPSASAARTLGDALQTDGWTLERHLRTQEKKATPERGCKQLWLLDEASLVSAADMARLLSATQTADAKLILVGDVKQLGSIGAGAAFAQLQAGGMQTLVLDKIVRQTNTKTREAVEHAIKGQAQKTMKALEAGGGRLIEVADASKRYTEIAKLFADFSKSERANTLVLDPSKEGRETLTAAIRAQLIAKNELGRDALRFDALVPKDMTKAERLQPASYDKGDVVIFAKAKPDKRIMAQTAYEVTGTNGEKGLVQIVSKSGFELRLEPAHWGQAEVFTKAQMQLREGDRVAFTRNDHQKDRVNGATGIVTSVSADLSTATLKTENGERQELDLVHARDQHLRHAWVDTIYAAQGKTAERVLIHAESGRTNLIDQKAMYVAISRAKAEAVIVTDSREKLIRGLSERGGVESTALNELNRSSKISNLVSRQQSNLQSGHSFAL